MIRVSKLIATGLMLLATAAASAQDFKLSIDNCPSAISGAPGESKEFDVFVKLTTSNNPGAEGAQGWSVSIAVDGGTVKTKGATIKGVFVNTLYNEDEDPETPLAEVPLDLGTADFKVAQDATGDYEGSTIPGTKGAVSAIVLNNTIKRVLPPNGAENILKLTLVAVIPLGEECAPLTIRFLDSLQGQGKPVKNVVTFNGASNSPAKEDCVIQICPPRPEFNLALVGPGQSPAADGATLLDLQVEPGVANNVLVNAMLCTTGLPDGSDGPQGWSVSIAHDACMSVPANTSVTIKGVVVDTLYNEDEDPETPLASVPLDLGTADFKVAQKATGDYDGTTIPGRLGVVSAIVLNNTIKRVLRANACDRILAITYLLPAVQENETIECSAEFLDSLQGAGKPVKNVITFGGASKTPFKKQGIRIRLTGKAVPKKSPFSRGDANDDGKNDIADAVTIVYAVVPALGGAPIACKDAGDADDSGEVNLADAVRVIDYQFRAGAALPAPFGACGTTDDSSETTCPPDSTNCPSS